MPKRSSDQNEKLFFGPYSKPNYTMVPDELFDQQLPHLNGAELKVLLYIIRRTFGFKKDSDAISLNQICKGITTHDGTILDHGTGLAKQNAITALKALAEIGLIVAERQSSPERGFEPTVYHLNIAQGTSYPLVSKQDKGSLKTRQGLVPKRDIQETVLQETDQQHVDDVVVAALRNFGLNKLTAQKIGTDYPQEYVLGKLEVAEWLVETHSNLVAKNPAGWLRKAIEEDYVAPRGYKTKAQRQADEEERATSVQVEQQQRQQAEEQFLRAREAARESLLEQFPPQPIPSTDLTTQTAWLQVLAEMKDQLTRPNFQTFVKDTILLSLEGNAALIAVPSKMHAEWLSARLDGLLGKTLRSILGHPVECQYRVASELVGERKD